MAIDPTWLEAPGVASAVDYGRYGTIYEPRNVPPASSLVNHEPTLEEAYPIQGHIGDPEHPVCVHLDVDGFVTFSGQSWRSFWTVWSVAE